MSTAEFDSGTELGRIDAGTSVLLTGDDEAVLSDLFYRLAAAGESERSVVLATDSRGRTVTREFDGVTDGAGQRTTVLAAEGRASDGVATVDDVGDLTAVGMELSSLVREARTDADRLRVGLFLCSSLCAAAEDTRSVYRFLNSNFLSTLRRAEAVGVCALDTSADIGANVDSVVSGLETSFGARLDVVDYDATTATVEVTGLPGVDDTVTVSRT
ncbi:hypothetical protein [Halobaculum sp. MBLA0143]|uniref:DUF7504 family protein n=1 Tax=Halobaculum sp. MBLA0143 TaxID=3079933 RepID=UPI00352327B3